MGFQSLYLNTTGTNNTAIGTSALYANTTAAHNTALGWRAGEAATTGGDNIYIGAQAGLSATTGNNNVVIGRNAFGGGANAGSNSNIAIGTSAMNSALDTSPGGEHGRTNMAVGHYAMDAITTGFFNTAIGQSASGALTTGNSNTTVGLNSGSSLTTGTGNVMLGRNSGAHGTSLTTGSNNTFLGAYCRATNASDGYSISIGYDVAGTGGTLTFGQQSTDTRCSHGGTSWSAPSDERYKKDIVTSTAGLSFINDLRPVTYKWKNEGDVPSDHNAYVEGSTTPIKNSFTNHGFIAQEVKTAIDAHSELKDGFEMWSADADSRQRLADGALIPILVKAIQELSAKVTALENA
jgi:hypothetical protein